MASQNPPTNAGAVAATTPGVYATAKECFRNLAKMLENGHSLRISTDDRDVIYIPMPTSDPQRARILIEPSLTRLKDELNQQSEWKEIRAKSRGDFFIVLYRADAFSSNEEAIKFTRTESKLSQLKYDDVSAI